MNGYEYQLLEMYSVGRVVICVFSRETEKDLSLYSMSVHVYFLGVLYCT